jgi:hypothetical protein
VFRIQLIAESSFLSMYTCISFPHDVDTTGGQQLPSPFFLEWGYHSRRSPIQVLTVPMFLHFCTRNRGNRCFNIVRPLSLEFGLLRIVRQPSADAHVIWVADTKSPDPKPSSNSDLPVAWITGPATDPSLNFCWECLSFCWECLSFCKECHSFCRERLSFRWERLS